MHAIAKRQPTECDVENLVDFFEAKFLDEDGTIHSFATWPGGPPLDRQGMCDLLAKRTIYTFNGNGYDLPIITLALYGADHVELKQAGDAIIEHGLKPWDFYKRYGVEVPDYIDHVDVMEVAAGVRISLKMYAGRMDAPKMQDLPVCPKTPLPAAMRWVVSDYCNNDLWNTRLMRIGLKDRLELREALSAEYGVDVRSKSDAQIAEAVIKTKIMQLRKEASGGGWVDPIQKRYVPHGYSFQYNPPSYLRYVTPQMREVFDIVRTANFLVTDKEEAIWQGEDGVKTGVQIPPQLKGRDIRIGGGTYRLGIGGLHSQESTVSYYADYDYELWDIDVKSYYPSMILNMEMYPEQLGPDFLMIYRDVYRTRLHAKSEADRIEELYRAMGAEELRVEAKRNKTVADGLKIVLNGTFGKLFSKYSILYAPEFGIRTTMTGQLSLLMLIEMMELSGIQVVSANTDGIVLRVPTLLRTIAQSNVAWWEACTKLEMEYSQYKSIHFRDVNNYIAITTKGKVKTKGIFATPGLIENKHPDKAICGMAVVAYVKDGTPIENTIAGCKDIRKFLQVRNVSGGGQYVQQPGAFGHPSPPVYLGKAVRWYYGKTPGHIEDKKSGNQVAGSKGATPLMELPDTFPEDVDYGYYVNVAYRMLADIGIPVRYWYHDDSDCAFASRADDPLVVSYEADGTVREISRKKFDQLI